MASRAAVLYGFGHSIRFVPDDILPEITPERAKRKGQHPRNTDHVLFLQSVIIYR